MMSLIRATITFALMPAVYSMATAQKKDISGVYECVSESEWNIKVDLRVDSFAVITIENWDPGDYDNRSIKETVATWEKGPFDSVILHYGGITDALQYYDRLSLKELGEQGAIPGLWQQGQYHPESKIGNVKLWRASHFPCAENPPQVLVMPEELVDVAAKSGYKQIDEFYDFSRVIDPPYLYGYNPTDERKEDKFTSAVFWCERWGRSETEHVSVLKYYLLVVSKTADSAPMKIDDVIEWRWGSFPGGLSLHEDTLATLGGFYYIDGDSKGPGGVKLKDKIIRCGDEDMPMDFYEYNGRWLIRMWD